MNHHLQTAKTYITTQKKEAIVGVAVILGGIVLISVVALFIQNSIPKVIYQPVKACDLLTLTEAKNLLGDKTVQSGMKDPTISGDNATSQCGYTDGNPDVDNMIVAAIIVRSSVNDNGVERNKTEFAAGRPTKDVEIIKDLGDGAYFNQKRGQLNILSGREWIILSYGVGSAPEANAVDKAIELAHVVLHSPSDSKLSSSQAN